MPQSPAGRKSTACVRCHQRKVKCSRELPCRNCQMANRECMYPVRDRNITVSESFVRDLKARAFAREQDSHSEDVAPIAQPESAPSTALSADLPLEAPLVEDTTSEVFLARLKEIRQQTAFTPRTKSPLYPEGDSPSAQSYDFVQLSFDTSDTPCTFSLPPYPYAFALVEQFDVYLGHDWHWFLRKDFRSRLDSTYRHPSSPQTKDRVWLCTLLVVFALGETYNMGPPPEIRLGPIPEQPEQGNTRSPPGTNFFEQALSLFKIRYEKPTINQIEALNLITFYSYSLNRKRTAYVYAGLSARLSSILRLHKPSSLSGLSSVQAEHVKRVWWTVYCLDRMTSTEMGLPPNFRRDEVELSFPSDEPVPPESLDQFASGAAFTVQVQLALLHTDIGETVRTFGKAGLDRDQNRAEQILRRLETLKEGLPPELSYDVENGLPIEMRAMNDRSLVSLYQRYYQCFVLLLRPFFLKQINYLLTGELDNANQAGLSYLTNLCLRAARTNISLITGLSEIDRLAKFGFWESLHLFSGLTILSLAVSVNSRWPGSFEQRLDDDSTYLTAKGILRRMAQAGNLASKGQIHMLDEVETLQDAITWTDSTALDLLDLWDTDTWMTGLPMEFSE